MREVYSERAYNGKYSKGAEWGCWYDFDFGCHGQAKRRHAMPAPDEAGLGHATQTYFKSHQHRMGRQMADTKSFIISCTISFGEYIAALCVPSSTIERFS